MLLPAAVDTTIAERGKNALPTGSVLSFTCRKGQACEIKLMYCTVCATTQPSTAGTADICSSSLWPDHSCAQPQADSFEHPLLRCGQGTFDMALYLIQEHRTLANTSASLRA